MACQRLGDLRVDALAREVPRLDLVFWVVAQRVEDGAPSLLAEVVAAKTVSEGATRASKGADSRYLKASTCTCTCTWGEKHALELAKRAVGLEHVAESNEATHIAVVADVVVGETVRQKASTVSRS